MKSLRLMLLVSFILLSGILPAEPQSAASPPRPAAQDQRPGPPGTIRVRVRLIPVDVIVTDDHDRPVLDLKADDFQVFENGVEQEVRHFALQAFTPAAAAPGQSVGIQPGQSPGLVPLSARTFLILLGRGRYQTPFKSVDALIRFVQNDLMPQDRVAVFAYNRATDFTTDHAQIVSMLERYKQAHEKIESWLESRFSGLAAIYASKEIPKSFQADIDRIFASGGGLDSRQVPQGRLTEKGTISRDWENAASMMLANSDRSAETSFRKAGADMEAEDARLNPDMAVPGAEVFQKLLTFDALAMDSILSWLPFDEFAPKAAGTFQDMQNVFTCIEYMRYMEGEKHLLFFSDRGLLFPSGKDDYDKSIAAVANDARVAIDGFQTGGVFDDPGRYSNKGNAVTLAEPFPPLEESQESWSRTFMISSMRTVSQLTGGRFSTYEDTGKALARVNDVSRYAYLLGYYPKDEDWNGKYREINVKVKRSGTKVSFRHGYFARDRLQPMNLEEFLSFNRMTAAGGYIGDIGDIPFKISATRITDLAAQQFIKVDMKIDCTPIRFSMVDGRHTSKIRVTIFHGDNKGNYLGADWRWLTLRLKEDTYQQYMQSGLPLTIEVPPKAPKQMLKVIVYDLKADKVGSKVVKVK